MKKIVAILAVMAMAISGTAWATSGGDQEIDFHPTITNSLNGGTHTTTSSSNPVQNFTPNNTINNSPVIVNNPTNIAGGGQGGRADAEAEALAIQHQLAIAAQKQSQTAHNEGVTQNVNFSSPREKTLYRGSISQGHPVGNEGPQIGTPWGALSWSKTNRVTKLAMYIDAMQAAGVDNNAPEMTEALQAFRKACGITDKKQVVVSDASEPVDGRLANFHSRSN